jgi:hypothetical protein
MLAFHKAPYICLNLLCLELWITSIGRLHGHVSISVRNEFSYYIISQLSKKKCKCLQTESSEFDSCVCRTCARITGQRQICTWLSRGSCVHRMPVFGVHRMLAMEFSTASRLCTIQYYLFFHPQKYCFWLFPCPLLLTRFSCSKITYRVLGT